MRRAESAISGCKTGARGEPSCGVWTPSRANHPSSSFKIGCRLAIRPHAPCDPGPDREPTKPVDATGVPRSAREDPSVTPSQFFLAPIRRPFRPSLAGSSPDSEPTIAPSVPPRRAIGHAHRPTVSMECAAGPAEQDRFLIGGRPTTAEERFREIINDDIHTSNSLFAASISCQIVSRSV